MLATNIVKIRHWLFPLCIRVIWPESIVLSTKQIPDCVGGARIAWDLWRVLFVNDGNFSKRMQDIIGQAGSGAVGGAGSIEATQLGPAASGARVSESDGVT